MKDNDLLMIILAFVSGFMLHGMMKNMCGGRLVEGDTAGVSDALIEQWSHEGSCTADYVCDPGYYCNNWGFGSGLCARGERIGASIISRDKPILQTII